jgi:hypothetical protein
MIKRLELTSPQSCLTRAEDDEPLFVLLARDRMAPKIIRQWVHERRAHVEDQDEAQLTEATNLALQREEWRKQHR